MALVVGAMRGPGARGLFVMVAGTVCGALGVGAGVPVGGRQGSQSQAASFAFLPRSQP